MSPADEVLCAVIQAFGARVSDDERVAGRGCPKRANILASGTDLTQWGRIREPFCEKLLRRALHLFDMHAISRSPSTTSVSAALLLSYLLDHAHPEDVETPRLMSVASLNYFGVLT